MKFKCVGEQWSEGHIVKTSSFKLGIFKVFCGETISADPICVGFEDDFDSICKECEDFISDLEATESIKDSPTEEDDRRSGPVEWPRNTDIDKR